MGGGGNSGSSYVVILIQNLRLNCSNGEESEQDLGLAFKEVKL